MASIFESISRNSALCCISSSARKLNKSLDILIFCDKRRLLIKGLTVFLYTYGKLDNITCIEYLHIVLLLPGSRPASALRAVQKLNSLPFLSLVPPFSIPNLRFTGFYSMPSAPCSLRMSFRITTPAVFLGTLQRFINGLEKHFRCLVVLHLRKTQ